MFKFDIVSPNYEHRYVRNKKLILRFIMILVEDVVKHFGGLAAVDGVSIEIKQ